MDLGASIFPFPTFPAPFFSSLVLPQNTTPLMYWVYVVQLGVVNFSPSLLFDGSMKMAFNTIIGNRRRRTFCHYRDHQRQQDYIIPNPNRYKNAVLFGGKFQIAKGWSDLALKGVIFRRPLFNLCQWLQQEMHPDVVFVWRPRSTSIHRVPSLTSPLIDDLCLEGPLGSGATIYVIYIIVMGVQYLFSHDFVAFISCTCCRPLPLAVPSIW